MINILRAYRIRPLFLYTRLLPFVLILAILVLSPFVVSAQSYDSESKKAEKYYREADKYYLDGNYEKALSYVDKSLSKDENYLDALLLKAELCLDLKYDSLAIDSYERIFKIDSTAFLKSAISLSKLYTKNFQFDKSLELLKWYLRKESKERLNLRDIAEKQLILTEFQKSLVENPIDYNPKNIGSNVNTAADEYINQYYINENKLIFTKRYKSESKLYLEEKVFASAMFDSLWSIPRLFIENYDDIGAVNMSSDGREIYFSGSGWSDGLGSCDIYCLKFNDGKWSIPQNVKNINTSEWESQPCISNDGKELYFVRRNRRGGASDIYVSLRDDNGNWMKPEKLNSNINTSGDEMAPFIHYDGKSLYFSSNNHLGMGGYDLFVSHRIDNEWSEPKNLGYPLNTHGDEINLVISNDAKKSYMSAVRDEGYGGYDIYEFDLDMEIRPEVFEVVVEENSLTDVLEKQGQIVLKNIFFEYDSYELTPDSEDGVAVILDYLLSNPDKCIVLIGHTDNMGDEDYNLLLSKKRADAVKDALVGKGVGELRIKTEGRGSNEPVFPNDSDENRARNRRVELRLCQ